MEKLFQFISNIFPSNPLAGTLGSIDLNLSFLQFFGIPVFSLKRKTKAYNVVIYIYGVLILTLVRLPYSGFELYDLALYCKDLNEVTQNMCMSMIHLGGLLKVVMVFNRLEDVYKINAQFEYMTKRYVNSAKQIDAFYWSEFENKISLIIYSGCIAISTFLAMVLLFLGPSSAVGEVFPYRARMPDIFPVTFKMIYLSTSLIIIGLQITGIDYLNVAFINLTRCQLQILNLSFDKLKEADTVDPLKHLNSLVGHHNLILDIRQQIESVFKLPMLVQFAASLFIFAVCGFQALVQSDTSVVIIIYLCVGCVFAQLFLYCWFGNEVSEQNKTLSSQGYETAWYVLDNKFKKTLVLFLLNAQKPLYFTAGGYAELSLLTFSRILGKSYTYIAVLRQQYTGK